MLELLIKQKIHIATITETHRIPSNMYNTYKQSGYKLFVNPTTGNASNGTVIIVHESLLEDGQYEFKKILDGRISKLKIKMLEKIYNLYCIYFTSGNYSTSFNRCNEINMLKESMELTKDNERNFIVSGDFNFVENEKDTINYLTVRPEMRAFADFKRSVEIEDIYRKLNPLGRHITRRDDNSAKRLDRIYISTPINKKLISHTFLDLPMNTDHVYGPLITLRKKEKIRWGKGLWKLNNTLLTKSNHEEAERIWGDLQKNKVLYDNVLDWWDYAKRKLKKFFIREGIEKKKRDKAEMKKLTEEMHNVQTHIGWSTEEKRKKVSQIRMKLNLLTNYYSQGQKLRSKIIDFENEKENQTDFYKLEVMNATSKQITELEVNETQISGKDQVMGAVHRFWKDLWGKKKSFNEANQNRYLEKYLKNDKQQKKARTYTIYPEEALKSLKKQNKKGSPGTDGYTPDFYLWAWSFLENDMIEVINNCYLYRQMSKTMRSAVVTIIPKEGNLKLLKNWRPVSLLNIDYKIISTIITERLKEEIESEISTEQKCAIKGRQISDIHLNILATLKRAKRIKQRTIVTAYDYRKAFDMIDHSIILKTLQLLNTSKALINWVKVLYKNITSQVQVNGALTEEIVVMRGIRQGCPLSMLLFVIALESLSRSLKQDENIRSPYDNMIIQQYADDLSTFTEDADSQIAAEKHIENFCRQSGLEINPEKTHILCFNLDAFELNKLKLGNPDCKIENQIKILGVYFNNKDIIAKLNWEERIDKMQKIVMKHKSRDVSIFGKVKLVNALLLPHINIVARLQRPAKNTLNRSIQ